jgi:two-component system nitrogen regulation response regulator GlnG
MTNRILVVDDEPAICWSLSEFFRDLGASVETSPSAEEGLARAALQPTDAVLLDVRLPGRSGLECIERFRQSPGRPTVIIMTAFGTLDVAVRAVQGGAFDYLLKPFDLDQAGRAVERALASRRSDAAPPSTFGSARDSADPDALVGSSPVMQEVFRRIALAAASEVPVLISGPSGSGKEPTARALHRHSGRSKGPFVPVCLPALSPTVIESELFGHVRGAFTGAAEDRAGFFERAGGGTLFLDEIGDMPADLQAKLLRVLETREVQPVGDGRPRRINVRIIAATNRNLPERIRAGHFREDLYYRLSVFPIALPTLAERIDDIPELARHFLRLTGRADGETAFTAETVAALRARSWPGNVRELRNAIEHAAVLARGGPIQPEHLPGETPATTFGESGGSIESDLTRAIDRWLRSRFSEARVSGESNGEFASEIDPGEGLHAEFLGAAEPTLLKRVLDHCDGNRTRAAERLGLNRATLRDKLRRFGLE